MARFKVTLTLTSPLATPLHSGTLFGHLCWAVREGDGEKALEKWLASLREAPFLVSDGFPAGWLPRPLLAPPRRLTEPIRNTGELKAADREKKLRKLAWIPVEEFLETRNRMSEAALFERLRALQGDDDKPPQPARPARCRVAHNTINRLTGTTPEAGGLFFADEWWPKPGVSDRWEVYVECDMDGNRLQALFTRVGEHGYGKDASTGRGRFEAKVEDPPAGLFDYEGNRRLSLSHGSLTDNMREARYKTETLYGKTGPMLAASEPPFKRPVTLLKPGATFAPANGGPFGELLSDVHPFRGEIVHNAWHLSAPYTEVETQDA